ncbi:MAG: DUF4133 domain-containing protein [Puia sp.]|nr:DUF4133 domain-containing protein [Puia sp.]
METKIYHLNKGLNRPLEFKGIKAQYILYLGLGFVVLLILFTLLHIGGVSSTTCVVIILPAGGSLYLLIQRHSKKYGEHGWAKRMASRRLPRVIKVYDRRAYYFGSGS